LAWDRSDRSTEAARAGAHMAGERSIGIQAAVGPGLHRFLKVFGGELRAGPLEAITAIACSRLHPAVTRRSVSKWVMPASRPRP